MKITPRGNEVEAVTAILESDEYADAKGMAKAIIKAVADCLSERDWFIYVNEARYGENNDKLMVLSFGPFTSDTEATKFAKLYGVSLGGSVQERNMVLKVYSPARHIAHINEVDTAYGATRDLCECGHFKGLHEHPKMGLACALVGCPCKRYTKQSQAA